MKGGGGPGMGSDAQRPLSSSWWPTLCAGGSGNKAEKCSLD